MSNDCLVPGETPHRARSAYPAAGHRFVAGSGACLGTPSLRIPRRAWGCVLGWIILGALGEVAPAAVGGDDLTRYQRTQVHMGMSFGVVLYAADDGVANRALDEAFARIAKMNAVFSDYDTDSELSRLMDQAPTPAPVAVSSELARILSASQDWAVKSGGAFDVTIGPLTKLWRRARRTREIPAADRIALERAKVDYRQLIVDEAHCTVELRQAGMRIDLGGIVPGYAADEALRVLARHRITRALVNASGDIVAGDPPPGEFAWKIDLGPLEPGGPPAKSVWVKNQAVSTSGDAFQFLEIAGRRYSHILDPRTGWGVPDRASVTVIAPTGLAADALATAASVLGPEKGRRLVESIDGAAGYFVVATDASSNEGSRVECHETTRFPCYAQQPYAQQRGD